METSTVLRNFALAAAIFAASTASAEPQEPVVHTSDGVVRGIFAAGVERYLGIPYAAPPVGDLRWRPPQPHAGWHGVRDAQAFAPHCAQGPSPFGVASASEDCLYLNVFAPPRAGGRDDGLLPVLVWIHGGALLVGESDDYDPARLVERGVVVVTLNYRLGVFGLLAHPALSAESGHGSGNYALMDQQAALRWVQRNIAAFGGDPRRVTIFGESAGGFSVHAHLASPASAGLFRGAIVESGAYSLTQPSLASAEALGASVATAVGCADQTAACLRAAPAAALLGAYSVPTGLFIVDGNVLPQSIGDAFAAGRFNRVPVIEGSNHDEWRLFVALDFDLTKAGPLAPAQYTGAVAATLGVPAGTAAFLASFYPLANYPSPDLALSALGTDAIFACNARKAARLLSRFVPVHEYEFADENAPQNFLPPVTFPYGSAHASEIQYLFGLRATVPAPALTPEQQRLSQAMVSYWTNFAKLGSPNFFGTPLWPPYETTSDTVETLAPPQPSSSTAFAADHKCSILWTP